MHAKISHRSALRDAIAVMALAVLMLTPWFFGGVLASAQRVILVALAVALGLAVFELRRTQSARSARGAWPFLALLGLGILLGLLQLTPLPARVVELLAPQVAAWRSEYGPDVEIEGALLEDALPMASTISVYPAATREHLAILILAMATFWLVSRLLRRDPYAGWLLGGLFATGLAIALFGLIQQFTWNEKLFWSLELRGGGPFGPFVNRNNAGGFLNMCLGCGLGLWLGRRREAGGHWVAPDILFGFGIALIAAAVFATASRGSILALLAAFVLTILLSAWVRPRANRASASGGARASGGAFPGGAAIWLLLLLSAAISIGMWLDLDVEIQRRFQMISTEQGLQREGRVHNWQEAWTNVPKLWRCGGGLNAYRFLYEPDPDYRSDGLVFTHAENQYLQTLIDAGVVGAGILLILIGLAWRAGWRCARQDDRRSRVVGFVVLFALTTQLVGAGFDFGLYFPAGAMALAAVVALAAGRAGRSEKSRQSSPTTARSAPAFELALAVMLICLCLFAALDRHRATALQTTLREFALEKGEIDKTDALRDWLARLQTATSARWDDAEAHALVADVWLRLYQLRLIDSLRQANPWIPPEDANRRTSFSQQLFTLRSLQQREGEAAVTEFLRAGGASDYLRTAKFHAQSARNACPRLSRSHLLLAHVAAASGQPEAMKHHLQRATKLAPGEARLAFESGELLWSGGDATAAAHQWGRSIRLSEGFAAQVVAVPGLDFVSLFDEFYRGDLGLILRLAHALQRAGQEKQALEIAELAMGRLPPAGHLTADEAFSASQLTVMQGHGERAMDLLKMAVEARPDEVNWRWMLAKWLLDDGDFEAAELQLTECVRRRPDDKRLIEALDQVQKTK